ncbi:MAG TPA: L-serine ammonia-lyase [Casimicrobiaceae bacterium]|nr:L-serine ammonia-lyase [Casimicrobiaceae bacterium]
MFVSAFDLFRIGPGPSSAHTTGPMRAARRFVHALEADGVLLQTRRIAVELYGSVACTGRDHGTDRAILSGLAGDAPEAIEPRALAARAARIRAEGQLTLNGRSRIAFDPAADVVFHVDKSFAHHANALHFSARDGRGETLATRLYVSAGDGELIAEDETPAARAAIRVPYPFASAPELLAQGQARGKKIADMARVNEQALRSPGEVRAGLLQFAATMRKAVERGLATDEILPGGTGRARRAATQAAAIAGTDPSLPAWAAVYATAVAEENAAGGRVVSAPSNGSAGPVAAVLHQWRSTEPLAGEEGSVTFLLAAAAVGQLLRAGGVRHAGCQGEIGIASAMAAAGLAAVQSGSNRQVLHAAERALEPFVGLACDPVGGLVQDPCIARNAAAAAHAVGAARFALRLPNPPVALDASIRAMTETGREMTARYKESSLGGLAVNVVDC